MTVAEVAKQRGVKEDTVLSYLGHAITAGYGFAWPVSQLPLAALPYVARLAQQILTAPPSMPLLADASCRVVDSIFYN